MYIQKARWNKQVFNLDLKKWYCHSAWDPPAVDSRSSPLLACRSVVRWLRGSSVGSSSAAACLLDRSWLVGRYSLMRLLRYWGCRSAPAPCEWWVQPCTPEALSDRQPDTQFPEDGRDVVAFSRAGNYTEPVMFSLLFEASGCSWRMYRK